MTAKLPYPNVETTGAMIRAGDLVAVRFVADCLKEAKGDYQAAADSMGVSVRVLYKWRDASPTLAKAFERHGRKPGRPRKE